MPGAWCSNESQAVRGRRESSRRELLETESKSTCQRLRQARTGGIVRAAGLVVISPEYNGGMPGILKYFIDMLKFPESFAARPVCFVGLAAGVWGALRPVEQLQAVFGYRNAHLYPERVFLPKIND